METTYHKKSFQKQLHLQWTKAAECWGRPVTTTVTAFNGNLVSVSYKQIEILSVNATHTTAEHTSHFITNKFLKQNHNNYEPESTQ